MLGCQSPLSPLSLSLSLVSVVSTRSCVDSKRLLALAAQKFIASISQDAFQHARARTGGSSNKNASSSSGGTAAKVSRSDPQSPIGSLVLMPIGSHNRVCDVRVDHARFLRWTISRLP